MILNNLIAAIVEIISCLWIAVKFIFVLVGVFAFLGILGILFVLLRELAWYVRTLTKEEIRKKLEEEKKDDGKKDV